MKRPYELLIEHAAERDLRKLPRDAFERVIAALKKLANTPRPPGSKKLAGAREAWRIRIGTYRVLYLVDDERRAVLVLRVRHRREAYR